LQALERVTILARWSIACSPSPFWPSCMTRSAKEGRTLAAIRSALTEQGRFVFEARTPLVRGWEAWTPDNAVEIVRGDAVVRMAHEVEILVNGDLISFTATFTSLGR